MTHSSPKSYPRKKNARRAKIKRHSRYHVIDGAETQSSGRARLVSILYSSGTKRRQATATIYANVNPADIGAGSEEMYNFIP